MANNEPNQSKKLEQYIGISLLILLLIGAVLVLRPFLSALVWAAILSFSIWPFHRHLVKWLRGRCNLAAMITTILIAMLMVVPFIVLGFNLADDLRILGTAATKRIEAGPPPAPAWLEKIPLAGPTAKKYWEDLAKDASHLAHRLKHAAADSNMPADAGDAKPSEGESKLAATLGKLITSAQFWLLEAVVAIGQGMIQIVLSVLLTFFMLRDITIADRLMSAVTRIAGERGIHLLNIAGGTIRSVVYGIIGTALAQGVVATVGFLIAGVPGAIFLGLLTFFLSPVPVGPPLVWIPAAIWLFSQGHVGWGVFMLIWGIGVSSVDNIVKPWIISHGSRMPFVIILFGVIGGALAFGFIGVFLGPVLLAMLYSLVNEWLGAKQTSSA